MGLFLSVLVACVGVVELINVCSNVRRNFTLPPVSGDLSQVRKNYLQELAEIKRSDLQPSEGADQSNKSTDRAVPTFRLNSHEDIEIEYNKNVLAKSRTPSPRRFLVTEKERKSSSPRQFVVSEEPQGIRKSQCQTSIPEFLIQEQNNPEKSPNRPRYVLKDHEGRSGSPIPLPSQFLVTENELATLQLANSSSALAETDFNNEECVTRPSSPYPPLDLPQTHRNSISKESGDDSVVSILEVDEDLYRSRSASPNIPENYGSTVSKPANLISSLSFATKSITQTQKDILAATVIERAKSISESGGKDNGIATCSQLVQTAVSSSQISEDGCTETFSSFVQEDFLENSSSFGEYLNNLDGLSKQKFVKRNYAAKKTVKRLSSNSSLEEESSSSLGESSKESATKILAVVDGKLENESPSVDSKEPSSVASTSKEPDIKKEPEPFWVNH